MVLPAVLFLTFTLLAAVGAYLIGAHFRGRTTGVLFGLGVVIFFMLLGFGIRWLAASAEGLP